MRPSVRERPRRRPRRTTGEQARPERDELRERGESLGTRNEHRQVEADLGDGRVPVESRVVSRRGRTPVTPRPAQERAGHVVGQPVPVVRRGRGRRGQRGRCLRRPPRSPASARRGRQAPRSIPLGLTGPRATRAGGRARTRPRRARRSRRRATTGTASLAPRGALPSRRAPPRRPRRPPARRARTTRSRASGQPPPDAAEQAERRHEEESASHRRRAYFADQSALRKGRPRSDERGWRCAARVRAGSLPDAPTERTDAAWHPCRRRKPSGALAR